jgi:hypothetical protein
MQRRKIILIIFVLLTVINIIIFIFRDAFMYQPYASRNELYRPCDEKCIAQWNQFVGDYPAEELKEAKRITDSLIRGSTSTTMSIMNIGSYLHNRFKAQLGMPSQALMNSSPLNQYKQLCSSDSVQLWCGNFAQIFSFFCWSQGITTRYIEIMYPGDHHVLNECYMPGSKSWAMVDVTTGRLQVINQQGKTYDLVSFKEAISQHAQLYSLTSTDDSGKARMLEINASSIPVQYLGNDPIYYYHRVDNQKVYTTANKISRYFLPTSWYDILENRTYSNLTFYLKEIFSFLWLVSFFVSLSSLKKRI